MAYVGTEEEMTEGEYFDFLLEEIKSREETIVALKNVGVHPLDANYRLEEGYLFCLVNVVKDLSEILKKSLSENFYPDFIGFIEENAP